jgi:HAD superfamily hydrolase (TIGR01509 family)
MRTKLRRRLAYYMIKVVVLDVDGTLMDTNYPHVEAWARAFEEVGQRVPRARIHKQVGKGSDKLISELIEDEEAFEKVDELHGEIYMDLQRHAYPLPGARELISSLAERGYEVWLVTNAKPEELEQYLDQLETEGKLSGIVKAAEVEEPKPASDVFELALEKAGGDAGEILAVGDAVWDVEAAAKAGIRTIAVLSGGAFSEEELEEAGAVAVYHNCAELLDVGFPENF